MSSIPTASSEPRIVGQDRLNRLGKIVHLLHQRESARIQFWKFDSELRNLVALQGPRVRETAGVLEESYRISELEDPRPLPPDAFLPSTAPPPPSETEQPPTLPTEPPAKPAASQSKPAPSQSKPALPPSPTNKNAPPPPPKKTPAQKKEAEPPTNPQKKKTVGQIEKAKRRLAMLKARSEEKKGKKEEEPQPRGDDRDPLKPSGSGLPTGDAETIAQEQDSITEHISKKRRTQEEEEREEEEEA